MADRDRHTPFSAAERGAAPSPREETAPRAPGIVAALAFAMAALAAAQAASVALTGEEVCLGEGCALVGRLTRIDPGLFNLFGAGVFGAAGALALLARRAPGSGAAFLLRVLLGAMLAAEGVLFAYQWHVAQAWCVYCLVILAGALALNLLLGLRFALTGVAAFAASAVIVSLLTFVPVRATLADGTLAVRPGSGPGGGPELVLLFSENCPHCRAVVAALQAKDRCTVRLNPVAELPASFWPELARNADFSPQANVAVARLLGLDTIPILIAREPAGPRFLTGEGAILRYVATHCGEPSPAEPNLLFNPWGGGSLLEPSADGCGLTVECE